MKGGDLFLFSGVFRRGRREFRIMYVGRIAVFLIARYSVSERRKCYLTTAIATRYSCSYPMEDLLGLPARLLTLNRAPSPLFKPYIRVYWKFPQMMGNHKEVPLNYHIYM